MSTTRAVWIFLLVLTAIRLALLSATQLSPDEAYYWMWSQRPALSYFSKGPGVAFFIRSSTAIFGDNEFGVRFWSPLLAAGTSLLLYYFAQRLFSATAGFWTVVALNVTPIFNLGSLVMTIDPLSIFFWVAAFYTFWLALERTPRFSWWWPFTGLLIGLGFLCKFTNALELISIVLVLLLVPRLRREFVRPNLYLLLFVFALCTLPPIVWNSATRLDHARAPALTRRSRQRSRLSSARVAFLPRRAFRDLFAAPFSRSRLGGDRELAPRAATFQRPLSALVRAAGVSSSTRSFRLTKPPRPTGTGSLFLASAFSRSPTGASAPPRATAVKNWAAAALVLGLLMSALLIGLMTNDTAFSAATAIRPIGCAAGVPCPMRSPKCGSDFETQDRPESFPHRRWTRSCFGVGVLFARETRRRTGPSAGLHPGIAGHGERVFLLAALRRIRAAAAQHGARSERSLHRGTGSESLRRPHRALFAGRKRATPATQHPRRLQPDRAASRRSKCAPGVASCAQLQVYACYDYRTMPL